MFAQTSQAFRSRFHWSVGNRFIRAFVLLAMTASFSFAAQTDEIAKQPNQDFEYAQRAKYNQAQSESGNSLSEINNAAVIHQGQ